MPDWPTNYGLSAGRFRDPRLQTGPFPQWPTLPPMPQPAPRYLENDPTAWEGGDFSSANATPLAIAMGFAGAKAGLKGLNVVKSPELGIHGETFYDAMHPNGGLVARLKVHPDHSVGNIWVEPSFQRHGIASALYDYAAKDRGVDRLGPGSFQTPEGAALRAAYDKNFK